MEEALALGKSYEIIQKFAEDVETRTNLRDVYDVSMVIHKSGGLLRKVSLGDWESEKYPFVEVHENGKYTISICAQFDKDLQRVLLVQGMGHFLLHSEAGKRPCFVSSPTRHPASRDGLWFSLAFLIPDKIFMGLKDVFDEEMLARFFRVPIDIISVKKKIIKFIG